MKKRILLVDDEQHILNVLEGILKTDGWVCETARDGEAGIRRLDKEVFDVAIVDQVMPRMTGLEMLKVAKERGISTPIMVLTGYGSVEMATEALQRGAVDFMQKPFRPDHLINQLNELWDHLKCDQNPVVERLDRLLAHLSFDPELRLEYLVSEVGLSPGYISDLLKTYFGMAFLQRLAWHRVRHAKMLVEFDEPLKAIALMCGFKNQQRMTEAFSRVEKTSPKKYRTLFSDRRKN